MRRRSKARVVWLPGVSNFSVSETSTWNLIASGNLADSAINSVAIEAPLVMDGSGSSPLDPTSTLADVENSGYRLRRIVGKIWVFIGQTNSVAATLIGVTAGLMVRRVSDTDGLSLAGQVAQAQINPALIVNQGDPWIWRRSWLLGNGPTGATDPTPLDIGFFGGQFGRDAGNNNGRNSGSALDGPHIDQKTARIVGPEERLFLDVSATVVLPDAEAPGTTLVCVYDLRVLGSMRSNVGNRRNASR